MAGAGPRWQPATLIVSIEQTLQDFRADLGKEEIVKRMRRAERVPKTGVRVKHTLMHLAVVRTEINLLTLRVVFVKAMRIHDAPIQRAVKCPALIRQSAFHARPSESFVPGLLRPLADGVKIGVADLLLQIAHCLFRTDE